MSVLREMSIRSNIEKVCGEMFPHNTSEQNKKLSWMYIETNKASVRLQKDVVDIWRSFPPIASK